ncbi:hypothetical protein ABT56_17870 [Photobacterium aquae]|uniref:Outer membrane protein beta-barrel domain-containing protein n=1 Tax=Photobacterium aquae TaxID=1195763 RepID=A0A0J1GVM1_9GAMM|nr:outer membrane beta-barrel protein [Photobacterium aquae]KLV03686.1 hypothetical protein ABT56_17870 [Photobacterium aquae]
MKRVVMAILMLVAAGSASADLLGISVGATAGGTRVEYDGQNDNGFEYGVNAGYHFSDFLSVNAGVVLGSVDVDANGFAATNEVDYTSFPITLRGDIPLLIGNLYAKAGTNYYDYDVERPGFKDSETGWGFAGGAGFVFTLLPFIDLSLGYEYRDMGEVTNNSVMFGIGASL